MLRKFLKSKIHQAVVTGCDLHYEGSIAIDEALLEAADIAENEAVHVWNVTNGERLETYAIRAPKGSGEVALNGAAARSAQIGDVLIIAAFCLLAGDEIRTHTPRILRITGGNRPLR
jgi:aspartate 1-decarboxylase